MPDNTCKAGSAISIVQTPGEIKKLAAWYVNGRAGTRNAACLVPKPPYSSHWGHCPCDSEGQQFAVTETRGWIQDLGKAGSA